MKPIQAVPVSVGVGQGLTEALVALGDRLTARPTFCTPTRSPLNHRSHREILAEPRPSRQVPRPSQSRRAEPGFTGCPESRTRVHRVSGEPNPGSPGVRRAEPGFTGCRVHRVSTGFTGCPRAVLVKAPWARGPRGNPTQRESRVLLSQTWRPLRVQALWKSWCVVTHGMSTDSPFHGCCRRRPAGPWGHFAFLITWGPASFPPGGDWPCALTPISASLRSLTSSRGRSSTATV